MSIFSILTDPFMNRRRVAIFSVIAVTVWVMAVLLLLEDNRPDYKRVILIVIDGLRSDAIDPERGEALPAFDYLMNTGASTLNARTDVHDTKALPNNVSILTGRPVYATDAAHRYTMNEYIGKPLHDIQEIYIHSVFDVLYSNDYRNAFFASKNRMGLFVKSYTTVEHIGDIIKGKKNPSRFQSYVVTESDQETFNSFMVELKNFDAHMVFLHLAGPETVGRASGWDTEAPASAYMREVARIDGYLGEILKTVQQLRHLRDKVYVIVTASHGGSQNPDDFQNRENYTVPFIVWGPKVARGADLYELNKTQRRDPEKYLIPYERDPQPIRNAEAGNLALKLLELPPIPSSIINGLQSLNVYASGKP